MSDNTEIVRRLRDDANHLGMGVAHRAAIVANMYAAADNLERLGAGDGAEVRRLRAALEPFARAVSERDKYWPFGAQADDAWAGHFGCEGSDISYGDLRRAREALSPPTRNEKDEG